MKSDANLNFFLFISFDKIEIVVKKKSSFEEIYKNKILLQNNSDTLRLKYLDEFLSENVFKIEKKIKKFIQGVYLIFDSKDYIPIEISIKNTFNEYKLGLKNLKIQKDNLEIFELNFNKSKELFLLGQLNSIQFREAQLNLINFKINYTANLYNTKIQEYLLYQFSGMLIIE